MAITLADFKNGNSIKVNLNDTHKNIPVLYNPEKELVYVNVKPLRRELTLDRFNDIYPKSTVVNKLDEIIYEEITKELNKLLK